MQITEFSTRTLVAVTTAPALLDYQGCNAQGLWCYVPGDQTASVVFSLSSLAADTKSQIGELVPSESDVIAVAVSANIPIYAFTRSGTASMSIGGIR
jgi:hypothetical protein